MLNNVRILKGKIERNYSKAWGLESLQYWKFDKPVTTGKVSS